MMDFGDYNKQVQTSKGRKRTRNKELWTKTAKKIARNSAAAKGVPVVTCAHKNKKTSQCDVSTLDDDDIKGFFKAVHENKTKIDQDNFLLKFIHTAEPKQKRPRKNDHPPKTRVANQYFIRRMTGELVRVCATSFRSITQVGRFRLQSLAKHFFENGTSRKENRGGSRMKDEDISITSCIKNHIQTFKCRDSHYSRGKSIRSYLPPELSVKKMWRLWKREMNKQNKPVCSYSKYYHVFVSNFNIGFGNPRADVCSFCELIKSNIQCTTDPSKKQELITKHRVHKLRALKFYQLLREENPNIIKIVFDMQQNQPLPKLSVTEVYYSRQIWLYNLTIVIHDGNQNKDNVFIYVWAENEQTRDSNTVCSAIIDFLKMIEIKYAREEKKPYELMLFSDSCSGQNKNKAMLFTLSRFIEQTKIFKRIQHIFPVRGHSYMPPDRVFGRIEKVLRKTEVIVSPAEYLKIFEEFGTVRVYGKDWSCYNIKSVAERTLRTKLPFKMIEQKGFEFCKNKKTIGCKTVYSMDYIHCIAKRPKVLSFHTLSLKKIGNRCSISEEKKNDVRKLLKYVEPLSAETRVFYDDCLRNESNVVVEPEVEEQDLDESVFF